MPALAASDVEAGHRQGEIAALMGADSWGDTLRAMRAVEQAGER